MVNVTNEGNLAAHLLSIPVRYPNTMRPPTISPTYKYEEATILDEMRQYVDNTYGEHYKKEKL